MRMTSLSITTFLAMIAVATVGFTSAIAVGTRDAHAGGPRMAVRCDYRGCSRIYCNYTGDRCFRVDDYQYGGRPYRYAGGRWNDPRYDYYGYYDGEYQDTRAYGYDGDEHRYKHRRRHDDYGYRERYVEPEYDEEYEGY